MRLVHADTAVDLSGDEISLLDAELRAEPDFAPGSPGWALAVILDQADTDPGVEFTGSETAELLDALGRLERRGEATEPLRALRATILDDLRRRGSEQSAP